MKLFEETSISGLKLKNRILRSATHEEIASPNEDLHTIYSNLAEGGVGGIITGFVSVTKSGLVSPRMPSFYSDDDYYKWELLLRNVKKAGVPIFLQITHGGGKAIAALTKTDVIAPSEYMYNGSKAREISQSEISLIIKSFSLAVQKAKDIGFDGVQIQASHGYLLSQFLSPKLNFRRDEWGGPIENRFRIIKEIFNECRRLVGNYPIISKISSHDNDTNGMRLNESVIICNLLEAASCDAIEVSCGNENGFDIIRSPKIPIDMILKYHPALRDLSDEKKILAAKKMLSNITMPEQFEDYNVSDADKIKSLVSIPIIVVGGIRKLSTMKDIIYNNKADFIGMSRPFIIEPDLVNKLKSGAQDRSKCLNCSYCLPGLGGKLQCYFNKVC